MFDYEKDKQLIERLFKRNSGMLLRLKKCAVRWGGDLEDVSLEKWDERVKSAGDFWQAPFTNKKLGVAWNDKRICYASSDNVEWPHVVHEMGHVFACPITPDNSREVDFFGWEYALARHVRGLVAEWNFCNGNYQIDDSYSWAEITAKKRAETLKERLAYARENGLVSGLTPLTIR